MKTTQTYPTSRRGKIDIPRDLFTTLGHKLIHRIAELFETLPDRPVVPHTNPRILEFILKRQVQLTDHGEDLELILTQTTQLLRDYSLFNGHPRFWGYITSSPAPIGAFGDLLSSALNANVAAWTLAPMATEIEKQTIQWLAQFIGFPGEHGVMVSGGNMANHVALLAAMRAKAGNRIRTQGLRGLEKPLVLYCAQETHTWIQKSADLAGLGTASIRWVNTDEEGRMDIDQVEEMILDDLTAQNEPFLIIGTAGTVSTGVIDPLAAIADIAKKYDMWFHIDGAYGGVAAALPEWREAYNGLTEADSVAIDPHKWLYVPLEASCILVKNPSYLTDTFSYHPPYYQFDSNVVNFVDYGPQNSRSFRALKVWLSFRHLGIKGHQQLIREDIQLAQYAYQLLEQQPHIECITQQLSITTFRFVPEALRTQPHAPETDHYLDHLNQTLLEKITQSGEFFLSNARVQDRFVLRLCIVNFRTRIEDIRALPEFILKMGQKLHRELWK